MKSRLIRIAKTVAAIYVGVLILLVLLERFLVYPAPSPSDGAWNAAQLRVEDVHFESADGTKLHGFYAEHPSPKAQILFCHGNGEHVGYAGSYIRSLADELEASVFAFDYRGYGKSEGKPHEAGVLADGEAAQKWLASRAGIAPDQIVLYGRSLGGGVAVYLAGEFGACALVAERTFHSMVEIGARQYPWAPIKLLMRNRYPSADRIANYEGPLLQLHGDADRLIPLQSARELHAACPSEDKQFMEIPEMGHNDPCPAEFYDAFKALLQRL